jgi:uncharacterized protein
MQISVYDITAPQFIITLNALKKVLAKGKAFADTKKIDMSVLLQTRLAPDQFPLARQIQIATDTAKGCCARLTGKEAPVFEDKETTYDEFIARIDKTIGFIKEFSADDFKNYESKTIRFPWYPGEHLEGKAYLVQHAIPNFYFHVTTSYAVLRSVGVDLGKRDFLGQQDWKKD